MGFPQFSIVTWLSFEQCFGFQWGGGRSTAELRQFTPLLLLLIHMFKRKRKNEKKWHQLQREGEGDGNSVFFLQKNKKHTW
jgi:hypothetical protein